LSQSKWSENGRYRLALSVPLLDSPDSVVDSFTSTAFNEEFKTLMMYLEGRDQGSDKRTNEMFNRVTVSFHEYYSPHILEKGEAGKVARVTYSELFKLRMEE
jgi:hypothetical protein